MVEGVTVVIPAYNEAHRLPATLDRLVAELPSAFGDRWDVVVADDGSTDATSEVVAQRSERHPSLRTVRSAVNQGKGAALLAGARAASFPLVVFLDADLPVSVPTIERMVRRAASVDLVVGSRCLPGARFDPPQPVLRRVGGRGFRSAVRLFGYDTTSDPQCGAKVLRMSSLRPVLDQITIAGFAFDVELIVRTRRSGLQVAELPVTWRHVDGSSLRPVRDAASMLADLARLRGRLAEPQLAVP